MTDQEASGEHQLLEVAIFQMGMEIQEVDVIVVAQMTSLFRNLSGDTLHKGKRQHRFCPSPVSTSVDTIGLNNKYRLLWRDGKRGYDEALTMAQLSTRHYSSHRAPDEYLLLSVRKPEQCVTCVYVCLLLCHLFLFLLFYHVVRHTDIGYQFARRVLDINIPHMQRSTLM